MSTIPEALERGWKHHQAGELAQAEQLYRQVLAADSRNVTAWQLLGSIGYLAIITGRILLKCKMPRSMSPTRVATMPPCPERTPARALRPARPA